MPTAPKGRTNAPNVRTSVWLAPYQYAWLREEARKQFPEAVGEPAARGPITRLLREIVQEAMERRLGARDE